MKGTREQMNKFTTGFLWCFTFALVLGLGVVLSYLFTKADIVFGLVHRTDHSFYEAVIDIPRALVFVAIILGVPAVFARLVGLLD
jgi:hypothetical protein